MSIREKLKNTKPPHDPVEHIDMGPHWYTGLSVDKPHQTCFSKKKQHLVRGCDYTKRTKNHTAL